MVAAKHADAVGSDEESFECQSFVPRDLCRVSLTVMICFRLTESPRGSALSGRPDGEASSSNQTSPQRCRQQCPRRQLPAKCVLRQPATYRPATVHGNNQTQFGTRSAQPLFTGTMTVDESAAIASRRPHTAIIGTLPVEVAGDGRGWHRAVAEFRPRRSRRR